MANTNDDIHAMLDTIAAGGLDSLSPEQVARLEATASYNSAVAGRLARLPATAEPVGGLSPELPSEAHWDQVWQRIAAARGPTVLRLARWRPFLAAAAVLVMMVGLWGITQRPAAAAWPVEWAQAIEVDALEAGDDATPCVLAAGVDDEIALIWMFEKES
ncbi:MAG: hypothetical protein KKB50_14410 [Planctomycetes bacterium]|nr:hypothetical protein [Planctomycetota bacterium]